MNLEDIARLAGVSRSTVSRAINNQPRVSPEVRARVLRIMEEHNFRPNSAARALARKRSGVIGLLLPIDFTEVHVDAWFKRLVASLLRASRDADLSLMLILDDCRDAESAHKTYEQVFLGNRLDGLLSLNDWNTHPLAPKLEGSNFPLVVIGGSRDEPFPSVDADNIDAGQQMARALLSARPKRIGAIFSQDQNPASRDRIDGMLNELREAGYGEESVLIEYVGFDEKEARIAAQNLMTGEQAVDAVIVQSDWQAHATFEAAEWCGLRVPDDIMIVGCDDFEPELNERLGLTTFRLPLPEMGSAAVDMLGTLIRGDTPDDIHPRVPGEMKFRRSHIREPQVASDELHGDQRPEEGTNGVRLNDAG